MKKQRVGTSLSQTKIELTETEQELLKAIYLTDIDKLKRLQIVWQEGVGSEGHSGDFYYHCVYLRRLGLIKSESEFPPVITEHGQRYMRGEEEL